MSLEDPQFEAGAVYQKLLNADDEDFFPLLAHEMLKPLNLLLGYADLALQGGDTALLDRLVLDDEHTAISVRFLLELMLNESTLLQQLVAFMRDHQDLRNKHNP